MISADYIEQRLSNQIGWYDRSLVQGEHRVGAIYDERIKDFNTEDVT